MKVRMKVDVSGTRDGVRWPARGEELTLPDGEARDLCAADIAEPVAEPQKAEKRPAVRKAEKRG